VAEGSIKKRTSLKKDTVGEEFVSRWELRRRKSQEEGEEGNWRWV
jgi:hypothetical protein